MLHNFLQDAVKSMKIDDKDSLNINQLQTIARKFVLKQELYFSKEKFKKTCYLLNISSKSWYESPFWTVSL